MKNFFVLFFCVFLPSLLIYSASVRSMPTVLYRAHLCMKCSFGISNFLEEISSLSHSIVFLYFFALITEEGFLILCYFLFLASLWNSAFKWVYLCFHPLPFTSLLFTAICKASSDNYFAFCISFFWGGLEHCPLYNVMNLCP